MKKVIIIGAGFGGLSTAAFLSKNGFDVTVIEKNKDVGGKAGQIFDNEFTFDIGPSWYMIPEVYERFFEQLGHSREEFYSLKKLEPSYRVFFENDKMYDIPSSLEKSMEIFEEMEPGSSPKIQKFLDDAKFKYEVALGKFLYKNFSSLTDFLDFSTIKQGLQLKVWDSLHSEVSRYVSDERIKKLLTWHTVFLGGSPKTIPSLYSLMAHADFIKNIWYPEGGFNNVAQSIRKIAEKNGATFVFNEAVKEIAVENGTVRKVVTEKSEYFCDAIVANADYQFVETKLLPESSRSFSPSYWEKTKLGCSTYVVCLGVNKRLPGLLHHNYYFSEDWDKNFESIFDKPQWPENPSYYISAVSKTDPAVAPKDSENLFLLAPVAPGLNDSDSLRKDFTQSLIAKTESLIGESFSQNIVAQHTIAQREHISWYNAYKGNALGLAHTLMQTAILRPSIKSPKVKNLFYTGQYTQPGTSVAITLISGELAAKEVTQFFSK
jgi:phytoene desaturase